MKLEYIIRMADNIFKEYDLEEDYWKKEQENSNYQMPDRYKPTEERNNTPSLVVRPEPNKVNVEDDFSDLPF